MCDSLYYEPETEEHIKGKIKLYDWIRKFDGVTDAVLEGWIPETKQRPDIMFKYKDCTYVIEYQCTPISSEFLERRKLYEAIGITDIWILGTEKYMKNNNTQKRKVIEKYTNYYFDSSFGVFMCNNNNAIDVSSDLFNYVLRHKKINYLSSNNKKNTLRDGVSSYQGNISTPLNLLTFNGKFQLNKNIVTNICDEYHNYCNTLLKYQSLESHCNSFINNVINAFSLEKTGLLIQKMNSKYSFKCCKHYYAIRNIVSYPIIDFCEITYESDKKQYVKIFSFNINNESVDRITKHIKCQLANEIDAENRKNAFISQLRLEKENKNKGDR